MIRHDQVLQHGNDDFFAVKHEYDIKRLELFLKERRYDEFKPTFDNQGNHLFSLRKYDGPRWWNPVGVVCVLERRLIAKVGQMVEDNLYGPGIITSVSALASQPIRPALTVVPKVCEKEKIVQIAIGRYCEGSDTHIFAVTADGRLLARHINSSEDGIEWKDITPDKVKS